MHIDQINLNNLRIFECVYKVRCMTTASKELHLTQSGVSQHIKALEDTLGVKLFDRINKNIIPTEAGERLYDKTRPALYEIEDALMGITENDTALKGTVRVGMPIEFGHNVIIPELAHIHETHPELRYMITMDFASRMNQALLSGDLDFAFVDTYSMDKRIDIEKVSEEVFDLVALESVVKQGGPPQNAKAYFETLEYIAYQDEEPILRSWFSHHLKRKNLHLKVRCQVMDVQGVAAWVLNGAGVGVLPDHLVVKLKEEGHKLHIFEGSGEPLKNTISLAYLKNRSRSSSVNLVMNQLKDALSARLVDS